MAACMILGVASRFVLAVWAVVPATDWRDRIEAVGTRQAGLGQATGPAKCEATTRRALKLARGTLQFVEQAAPRPELAG